MVNFRMLSVLAVLPFLLNACALVESFNPLAKQTDRESSTPAAAETDRPSPRPAPQAQLSLAQEGSGRLIVRGNADRTLTAAFVNSRGGDGVDLAFQDADGNSIVFAGELTRLTPNTMTIQLSYAGATDTSGRMQVEYGSDSAISRISGSGLLGEQEFFVEFNPQDVAQLPQPPESESTPPTAQPSPSLIPPIPVPPSPSAISPAELPLPSASSIASASNVQIQQPDINLFREEGGGLFSIEGQLAQPISNVSVIGRKAGKVDLTLRFQDGEQIRLSGEVEHMDAYTLTIQLTHADRAAASGAITVGYSGENAINVVYGNGTLDEQPFAVQFSRPETAQAE